MKTPVDSCWQHLHELYPDKLVKNLRQQFDSGESFVAAPWELAERADCSKEKALECLKALAEKGHLEGITENVCPSCSEVVTDEMVEIGHCHCGQHLDHDDVDTRMKFLFAGVRRRDIRWVVTLHGMNTHGAWQQDFAWRISKIYKYAIPTFIYKYGWLLVSPLLIVGQGRYRSKVITMLRLRIDEMVKARYSPKPDVIAHSFGT